MEGKLLRVGCLCKEEIDYPTVDLVVELMAGYVYCRLDLFTYVPVGWTGKLLEQITTVLLQLFSLRVRLRVIAFSQNQSVRSTGNECCF